MDIAREKGIMDLERGSDEGSSVQPVRVAVTWSIAVVRAIAGRFTHILAEFTLNTGSFLQLFSFDVGEHLCKAVQQYLFTCTGGQNPGRTVQHYL